MMVNFLLAIVVNAHTVVTEDVNQRQTEQNIIADLWDMIKSRITFRKKKWPTPAKVLELLEASVIEDGGTQDMPAVTARELNEQYKCDGAMVASPFNSLDDAQAFIDFYAKKLK